MFSLTRKKLGALAEAKVLAHLVSIDIDPYLPYIDNGPIDIIGIKNEKILKISVKGTTDLAEYEKSWIVQLRTVSRRKDNEVVVNEFDNSLCDIVAVYIHPLDKVVLIDAKKITAKTATQVRIDDERQWLDG